MDITKAARPPRQDTPAVEELTADILRVKPRQVSRNGNAYTLLETPFATQVFVWDRRWRREIEQHIGFYFYLDARLFVRNQTPDAEDPFYWLDAVVPQSEAARRMVQRRWERDGCEELVVAVDELL
ncbi:hypothetical protein [Halorarum salinum]|uniref:Uncharacterized protein n=1 Tax=Halorarum salinum TaxID=2743089 RepID=A0A7D5QGG7_9EURY|nr:hypothetical protein [Halobaculum salinum]QLG62042.1 hypothetical protein HUG12_10015 [Halobaculum salinum]